MRNKKVTVSFNDINLESVIEIDAIMSVSGTYDNTISIEVVDKYPNQIYIHNTTGSDLLWNVLSNDNEYFDYQNNPEQFALIPIKSDKILQTSKISRCYKLLLQLDPNSESNALSDLDIYFINYN